MITAPDREMMNKKPVLWRDAKSVINDTNQPFQEKLLCDGIIFNLGDACAYSCSFCYVESVLRYQAPPLLKDHNLKSGEERGFSDVVIRRRNAIDVLKNQLLKADGSCRYPDPSDHRVAYSSTTVDVAANMELLKETADACNLILDHTGWQIRLLSKSNLLHRLVKDKLIPERHHQRIIFGFSTGTLDDRLAKAFEAGTALVSKRLESLHWLQDRGFRTFGMICPSLPQADYDVFSRDICQAIRPDRCEHVWAEVINLRGKSLTRTLECLRKAGLDDEADRLDSVSGPGNSEAWEQYARDTFLAHVRHVPAGKLRYLQYIDDKSADWWADRREKGAVLLGKAAEERKLTITPVQAPLTLEESQFLAEREGIVEKGMRASIAAAKALFEIHDYDGGRLWRRGYPTFEAYCRARWEYAKSHSYRLVQCGEFVAELEKLPESLQSPNGDWLPRNEGQIRPLLSLPKQERVACWRDIVADSSAADVTSKMVTKRIREQDAQKEGQDPRKPTAPVAPARPEKRLVSKLREKTADHANGGRIGKLLDRVLELLG